LTQPPLELISVRFAVADSDLTLCHSIRRAVFVDEQGINPLLEFDESDNGTQSLLAYAGRMPVGVARLALHSWDIQLGRVAVLPPWRQQGIGKALVETAIEFARKRRAHSVVLHSQTTVVPFYEKFGFVVEGGEYLEAGIPHLTMRLVITHSDLADGALVDTEAAHAD